MTGSSKITSEPAWEFFDLKKDPKENHNAYNDPAYSEIIKEMKIELQQQRELVGDTDVKYPIMQNLFENYWSEH